MFKTDKIITLLNSLPIEGFKLAGITKYRQENVPEARIKELVSESEFKNIINSEAETKNYFNKSHYIFYYYYKCDILFGIGVDCDENKFLKPYDE